jgi:hypothetical protein
MTSRDGFLLASRSEARPLPSRADAGPVGTSNTIGPSLLSDESGSHE